MRPTSELLLSQLALDAGERVSAREHLARATAVHATAAAQSRAAMLEAQTSAAMVDGDIARAATDARQLVDLYHALPDPDGEGRAQHRLGQALALLGQFPKAADAYAAAIRILERFEGAQTPRLANVYHDAAWGYRLMGDYPRAEFFFAKAIDQAPRCTGPLDTMPVLRLRERALLYLEEGHTDRALADIDVAEAKLAHIRGETRTLHGLLLATRAFAQDRSGHAQESAALMRSALELITAAEGPDSINLPLGQVHLAQLALRAGDNLGARVQSSAALEILDAHHSHSVWGTATALGVRAAAERASGDTAASWQDTERFVGRRAHQPCGSRG